MLFLTCCALRAWWHHHSLSERTGCFCGLARSAKRFWRKDGSSEGMVQKREYSKSDTAGNLSY